MRHPKHSMPGTQEAGTQRHFPCDQCGADLLFTPGAHHLTCDYCGHQNALPEQTDVIREYDLKTALDSLANAKLQTLDSTQVIKCPNCAATFELKVNQHAGDCPFCGTPVVMGTEQLRLFQPKALLPFKINEKQAQTAFEHWIGQLWFAPSALKNKAKRDEKLLGIYIPYWTYDSQTDTLYRGERGIVYYERRVVTRMVNGRARRQVVNIPRVRWNPASGRVQQFFDDILVGASHSLPRKILDSIHPWDTENLVPYDQAYLSGFQSEIYQVNLDSGYQRARQLMDHAIRQAIRQDIGGDQQRIHSLHTHHSHTSFKTHPIARLVSRFPLPG